MYKQSKLRRIAGIVVLCSRIDDALLADLVGHCEGKAVHPGVEVGGVIPHCFDPVQGVVSTLALMVTVPVVREDMKSRRTVMSSCVTA